MSNLDTNMTLPEASRELKSQGYVLDSVFMDGISKKFVWSNTVLRLFIEKSIKQTDIKVELVSTKNQLFDLVDILLKIPQVEENHLQNLKDCKEFGLQLVLQYEKEIINCIQDHQKVVQRKPWWKRF